jgi:hypothetical protein
MLVDSTVSCRSIPEALELDEDSIDAIEDCEPFAVALEVSVLYLMVLRARPSPGH